MSDHSAIEWTDATWNPVTGCTKVSPGCDHCYAERVTNRFQGLGAFDTVVLHPDRLDQPLRWRKPRKVFVNSMSDLFHEQIPDEYVARVFAVMALAPQHTFQILTKRHGRMRSLLNSGAFEAAVDHNVIYASGDDGVPSFGWPLSNVWLGVSVETQQWADIRIPALLDTPAAVRFLSCEPLLGPVELRQSWRDYLQGWDTAAEHDPRCNGSCDLCPVPVQVPTAAVTWVIVGGESGPGARPMHPDWARSLRDQCQAAGVPFFMKQAGNVLAREWGLRGKGDDPGAWPETFPRSGHMQAERTILAYLAGVIDSDGYVTATRVVRRGGAYYGAQIGITGSRREPHDLAAATFGGRVAAHSPGGRRSHHLTQYHWQLCGSQVVPIIEDLLPYLRVKRGRAVLVRELQLELDDRRSALRAGEDPFPWAPAGYDPTPAFDALVADIRDSSRGRTWDEFPEAVQPV